MGGLHLHGSSQCGVLVDHCNCGLGDGQEPVLMLGAGDLRMVLERHTLASSLVFFFTIGVLTVVADLGFIVNTASLLFHDLPKKTGFGIILQVLEIIGEFAEAYQDNKDEKKPPDADTDRS